MLVELALFISFLAIGLNFISFWAIMRIRNEQREVSKRAWDRLNYLEVGMSYHGMIPMPWEIEEVEELVEEIKSYKHEGNVVYLQKD
jgi:hypothetical protein